MRKRNLLVLCLVLLMCCLLAACAHEHRWVDASCFSPRTCTKCGETEGEIAPHKWVEATCQAPKYCDVCGEIGGDPVDHSWSGGSDTDPRICQVCEAMEPLALPENGKVFLGEELYRESELTIKSSSSNCCYIKLKGSTGTDVFSFFVRAGETVTVSVPRGYYYVYFSYGNEWYGTEHLFGEATTYAKDDELLDFENYTWEYTLEPVTDGNFSETPVDADEFK